MRCAIGLEMPHLVVLDVARLGQCRVPRLPTDTDGVLLDGVANETDRVHWQTLIESHAAVPVLGWMGELPQLRKQIAEGNSNAVAGHRLSQQLAAELMPTLCNLDRILKLARANSFPAPEPNGHPPRADDSKVNGCDRLRRRVPMLLS